MSLVLFSTPNATLLRLHRYEHQVTAEFFISRLLQQGGFRIWDVVVGCWLCKLNLLVRDGTRPPP